jgi:uncharacterized protein YcbK (DUF882 family)
MTMASDHFAWREFYCPVAKHVIVSDLTMHHIEKLENLRLAFGAPLRVTSGYRCPEKNAEVGGAKRSMHLEFATDIAPTGPVDVGALTVLHKLGHELGFTGVGQYNTFLHFDCREYVGRTPAEWDNRT